MSSVAAEIVKAAERVAARSESRTGPAARRWERAKRKHGGAAAAAEAEPELRQEVVKEANRTVQEEGGTEKSAAEVQAEADRVLKRLDSDTWLEELRRLGKAVDPDDPAAGAEEILFEMPHLADFVLVEQEVNP